MTSATATTAPAADRTQVHPPSLLATGIKLAEVRWAAAALALFLVGGAAQLLGAPAWVWWTLYLACYATGGWDSALSGLRALKERTLDVDLLMIVAAIAAASIGQVFDGALLIVIFATSGALEAVVTQRTADSVSALLNLAPERAVRLTTTADGEREEIVETSQLQVGEVVLVRPGERLGADGTVIDGRSEVDQQAITGESVPVPRGEGDEVLSGTINGTGALRVRVARPAGESVIARIVTLVEEASATKAQTQLFIERIEQRYSALVVVGTLLVLGIPLLFLGHDFEAALLRAIVFMIVASPCAVVLSTMPPLLASIANAGRHGVLVKSATVMEQIGRTDLVAFDKTGTLTQGEPRVAEVEPESGHTAEEILAWAAAAERNSEHPLARAICAHADQRRAAPLPVEDFASLPGIGVSAIVDGDRVRVERAPADPEGPASTQVVVSVNEQVRGRITLTDTLRPEAARTVEQVGALTTRPVHLLTGDNAATAAHVAGATGIDRVHAALLPQDKAALVKEQEDTGAQVLLVGDGVNDAPAMAAATIGVAMGRRGSDLALDTADAIVVRDDLSTLPRLIALSRRARRFVIANLCIAGTFIVVLVTWDLVATLPLALAVAGHEGSTVIVALNGIRLLRERAWTR
ncbi:heavy metal translocating P-type ATPase [Nocardiopsis valliformis]|uniref:heavy metal translocating P-type ATPase n=1 Tax=Nocardiopsis valliformis TaxID=239974 RepID=UPI0003480E41|nr:heavy metal translocating P-type ATPase [Nocardiopsis valliformis]